MFCIFKENAYLCIVELRGKGNTLKYNFRDTQTKYVKKCQMP